MGLCYLGDSISQCVFIYTIHAENSKGKPVYHCRLASKYIDVELEEMIIALSNPELADARKKKKKASTQKWADSPKSSKDGKQSAAKKVVETARASKEVKLSAEKRKNE